MSNIKKLGWICPICNTVWSPFLTQCINCVSCDAIKIYEERERLKEHLIPVISLTEHKGTKVQSFIQGTRKGTPFTKFSKGALLKWLNNQEHSEPKTTELGQDIANLTKYLAALNLK